jgi:hypothetical protein
LEALPRANVGNHGNRAASLRDNNRVPAMIFDRDRPTDKLLISFDQVRSSSRPCPCDGQVNHGFIKCVK